MKNNTPYLGIISNKYAYRIRVPRDLLSRIQKTELKRSLKTSDIRIAKRRTAILTVYILGMFERIRMNNSLSQFEIERMTREFYHVRLDEDVQARSAHSQQYPVGNVPAYPVKWEDKIDQTKAALMNCDFRGISQAATGILASKGLSFNDSDLRKLCEFLLRAELEANIRGQERSEAIFYGEATDSILISTTSNPVITTNIKTSHAIVPESIAHREELQQTPTEIMEFVIKDKDIKCKKEIGKFRKAALFLQQTCGTKSIVEYNRSDAIDFKNMLMKLPSNFASKLKTDNVLEAINLNVKRDKPIPTIKHKTINTNYFTPMHQMFEWLGVHYQIENADIFSKLNLEKTKKSRAMAKDARHPFNQKKLNILFSSALFLGCRSITYRYKPGDIIDKSYRFWLPLFIYLCGIRPNEFGQLETSDIIYKFGYPCLDITNNPDDEEYDENGELVYEKSVKSPAGNRIIPINKIILELGFMEHLQAQKEAGSLRVFPDLELAASRNYSDLASKFFNRENGFLERLGIKSKKHVLYSLRHNYKDLLRANGIGDDSQDLLMGHENERVSGIYGNEQVFRPLLEAARSIVPEGVDFSKIPVRY